MHWEKIKSDPFGILGMHYIDQQLHLRVLDLNADSVSIINSETQQLYPLENNGEGLWTAVMDQKPFPYRILSTYPYSANTMLDPYSFEPVISDFDIYLFNEGTHRKVWNIMGANFITHQGVSGICFAVWAPAALSVRLTGDFNGWDAARYFMRPRGSSGIWEIFIPELDTGHAYKFVLEHKDGSLHFKADPYAVFAEHRPNTASVTYDIRGYEWQDNNWMQNRNQCIDKPLSIYECHLDSWIKDSNGNSLRYSDIALPLAEYLLEHGFTHLELMPIAEYPYDGSWGYQVTGYFAPTSRYGTPDEFMEFIDVLHQKNIGVIVDWVPAHFPQDDHGLERFDGTALYEHEDPRLGWHHDWDTYIFNYGRHEVRQFLIGSALYWLDIFHIDGLRVDAVASMLYLDYSRKEGEWVPNRFGGRENLEAIEFLQSLHAEIERYFPTAMTIAEESTSFQGVTAPTDQGGLGFTYKWNMGWMNDTLKYFSLEPIFRKWHHHDLTFSMVYAFHERFILPFSHDEVVHGKGTLLSRMPGSEWEKFANLRLMLSYMWFHPGKKLLFAGQEFAPWDEWAETHSIDWHLNADPDHAGIRFLIRDLNKLYQNHPALYQFDFDPKAFSWIDCDNIQSGLLQWIRRDMNNEELVIILNLNVLVHESFQVGMPGSGLWIEIFNSDQMLYGGTHTINGKCIAENQPWQQQPASMKIKIPPLAALCFYKNIATPY